MRLIFGYVTLICFALLVGTIFLPGCSDDDNPVDPGPPVPVNPDPAVNAGDIPVMTTLKWSYSDFDPATDYFNVYFGVNNPPPLLDSMITDSTYDVGPLYGETVYYWKITAHPDGEDSVVSAIWKFNTAHTFSFPFGIGNTWTYELNGTSPDFEGDSVVHYTITAITEITTIDTLNDTLETYIFQTDWTEGEDNGVCFNYRTNTVEGLFVHAYENSGWVGPPKKELPQGILLEFGGRQFKSMRELCAAFYNQMTPGSKNASSIIMEPHPIQELKYPLEIGQEWMFRNVDLGDVWDMKKSVLSIENVTVPAGSFECFKIRWFWDIDHDGQWDETIDGYDYVCDSGYIKRTFFFYDIIVTNAYGEPLDTLDCEEIYELTSFELQ